MIPFQFDTKLRSEEDFEIIKKVKVQGQGR